MFWRFVNVKVDVVLENSTLKSSKDATKNAMQLYVVTFPHLSPLSLRLTCLVLFCATCP